MIKLMEDRNRHLIDRRIEGWNNGMMKYWIICNRDRI